MLMWRLPASQCLQYVASLLNSEAQRSTIQRKIQIPKEPPYHKELDTLRQNDNFPVRRESRGSDLSQALENQKRDKVTFCYRDKLIKKKLHCPSPPGNRGFIVFWNSYKEVDGNGFFQGRE